MGGSVYQNLQRGVPGKPSSAGEQTMIRTLKLLFLLAVCLSFPALSLSPSPSPFSPHGVPPNSLSLFIIFFNPSPSTYSSFLFLSCKWSSCRSIH